MCFLLASFLLAACTHQPPPAAPTGKDTLLLYLMAGQSNMAGRGAIGPEDTGTDLRILMMDTLDQLVVAHEPLHRYQPSISGLDCGLSFARTLTGQLHPRVRVGMIPCAVGSTSVEDWLHDSVRVVPLYTNFIRRARAGARYGVIKGILWHQGEANAADSTAGRYAARFSALIRRWRSDLGAEVPVFAGQLAGFSRLPYAGTINEALEHVAATEPGVWVIDTHDLSCKADSLHFDAAAQRLLGQRFAAAALRLLQ